VGAEGFLQYKAVTGIVKKKSKDLHFFECSVTSRANSSTT